MNYKTIRSMLSLVAVLLLAACGSSGLGDILGGGSDGTVINDTSVVRGTVDRVDTRNRPIVLRDAETVRSSLADSSGMDTIYLDYDENTFVEYGGNRYEPTALESGDRVEATSTRVGNRLVADRIDVTYDVSRGTTNNQTRLTELRGIVTDVNTRNRTISVERDSWSNRGEIITVGYETNTPVYWKGQTYRAENLERGDVIDLELRDYGTSVVAQEITVIESASSTTGSATGFDPDIRGTVQWVDTSAKTLTIERPTWMRNFDTGGVGNTVTLRYDASTTVIYNRQTYSPENLERGDEIEIEVRDLGSALLAEEILVVDNVRTSSRY